MVLRAFYDESQDKIFGCKEGSLVWYYEVGHRRQYKSGIAGEIQSWSGYALLISLAFMLGDHKVLASLFLIVICIGMMYLEIDAWIYAFKKMRELG